MEILILCVVVSILISLIAKKKGLKPLTIATICVSVFVNNNIFAADISVIGVKVKNDYSNFYSKDRLTRLGVSFLTMGVVANTDIDNNIQEWYQNNIRSQKTDKYSKTAKLLGEGKYLLPISALASSAYYFNSTSKIGNWGLNSARAYALGLPAMWTMQSITGASRPRELNDSNWRPFNDNNGVSGHSFVGAVPLLTLAKMNDNKFIKYLSYAASGFAAWSRVNDNAHYTSQAILGWYMAYESVGAVFDTNNNDKNFSLTPVVGNNSYGISFSKKW